MINFDDYQNSFNKYGTPQDNSTAYEYFDSPQVQDVELSRQYASNGFFATIINRPAADAVKHGFSISVNSALDRYVKKRLVSLNWSEKMSTAMKWARLYGGVLVVMLIDDGNPLEYPLNWNNIRGIDEIRVYERPIVSPESDLPEWYIVNDSVGTFKVHKSRCLVFQNGSIPQLASFGKYRYWGIPEYIHIKEALRNTVVTHGLSQKLLERSSQAIFKMKNLSELLMMDEGESQAIKRLQAVDIMRGIINTTILDTDDQYYFDVPTLSGVREIVSLSCEMLSAVTNIPAYILFGGDIDNSDQTGAFYNTHRSDMVIYYDFVERLQSVMLKPHIEKLVDCIMRAGSATGDIQNVPDHYDLSFNSLWSSTAKDDAKTQKMKVDTKRVRTETAQLYVNMGVLTPSEGEAYLKKVK